VRIPRLIHQLWRDEAIPSRWQRAVDSVQRYHKGWEYRLWTDSAMMDHVRTRHADFYATFASMERQIMRVDVFRYILMYDFGGLYCDLDYEFLRPYDYGDAGAVLSLEYDEAFGDEENQIANYVFASAPGHLLWENVLADLYARPPRAPKPSDVCIATGPKLISRVYYRNAEHYRNVRLTPQPVFSPRRVHGRYERKFYLNSGITFGFHHGWGSWRERMTMDHIRAKIAKWLGPVRNRPGVAASQYRDSNEV
jgi:mannosyltransferase OCH1-like enzyme